MLSSEIIISFHEGVGNSHQILTCNLFFLYIVLSSDLGLQILNCSFIIDISTRCK